MSRNIKMGKIELELLTRSSDFLGIGRITVAGTDVRTGSLPMRPCTATHNGIEFDRFVLDDIQDRDGGMVLRTRALGVQCQVAALLDHSLDPVWNTKPWDGRVVAEIKVDWELAPATRTIGEHTFEGFTYAFHVETAPHEIYYLLDRATWELGGDAVGITLLRQQMGTDPRVTLHDKTSYSTSSKIGYPINPVMTHDIPRWASEQGFDYQYRNGTALVGIFSKCGLIRTIVERDAGDPGIRHFDKHIFDQTSDARTVTKFRKNFSRC